MKRTRIDLRLLPLRHSLLSLVYAHASEHGLALRSAIKELKAAAGLLCIADFDDSKRPKTQAPLIPAYKTRAQSGALLIQFRCPVCGRAHTHGMPAPTARPLQYRVSHCDIDVGRAHGYRLLVVGWSRGEELPACSASEIDALNAVISEVDPL